MNSQMNVPNLITSLRILLIPVFAVFFYLPYTWAQVVAGVIFAIAAITDWVDGYLARSLKQHSPLGAFLDPVADKLIVAIALVLIVAESGDAYLAIPAAVIIGREILVSGLREWMAEIGKRSNVAVSFIGKAKTLMQMIAVIILLAYRPFGWELLDLVGTILLYLSALAALWSMYDYLKAAWPELNIK